MVKGYRYLEHISDAYVECWGGTLEEAFESAGEATFNVMTDISLVEAKRPLKVEVEAEDLFALLVEWLSELLFLYDTRMMYFSRFDVHGISRIDKRYKLTATVWGEEVDQSRHPPRTEVKAATYSLMEIVDGKRGVTMRFVLDI
ncbi:TPA: archease [Candidatus Bathyarchaeota archaeon]|nr:archease [Candidatus Bathyarchaeota archaeon]